MAIINLTQHAATADQIGAGVVDLPAVAQSAIKNALTFDDAPTQRDMLQRADAIATIVNGCADDLDTTVMIGGAPFFMPVLASYLKAQGWDVVFAFSKRHSVDQPQPDGTVKKVATFKHAGFVSA